MLKGDNNNRLLVTFLIINRYENLISSMILDGIKSIIDVLSAKNVYTYWDVISILYDNDIPQLVLDKTT